MSKKIYLKDSKDKLMEGVNLYADAVKSTLGPSGKCVIINNCDGSEIDITKDGVTVGNSIDHSDPVINTGIQLIKRVASKTDEDNGDGTTTASVLCRELIKLGMELNDSEGFNDHEFRSVVEKELEYIIEELEKKGIKIPLSDIGKIAFTSSNNDREIADLFQVAFDNAKEDGHINIIQGTTERSFIDIMKGYVLDLGYMDRRFANNPTTGFFEADKARVLIYDNEFTDRREIVKLIQKTNQRAMPIIIIAKDFSKDVLSVVDYNNEQIGNKICLIKNQLRNDEYASLTQDISVYIGAEPVKSYDDYDSEFGEATNVIVKQGYTVFGELEGTQRVILDAYLDNLKLAADQEKSTSYADSIYKRIDRINNGITTYHVGGNSSIEIKEKMDRVQDSYRACKLALKGKVIIGGGQSLVLLSKDYNNCNVYELLFSRVMRKPFYEILSNSFHNDDEIISIRESITFEKGYNAKTREFEDLYESGIVDSVDAIINYLKNAVSIALTILSTECLIVETNTQNQ